MAIADHPTTHTSKSTHNPSDDLRVPLRRVEALYRIGESLLQATQADQAYQLAIKGLVELAGYGNAWILTIDAPGRMLRGQAGIGVAMSPEIAKLAFPLDQPEVHSSVRTAVTGQPIVVTDIVSTADREGWGDIARAARLKSSIYVPFGRGETVLGVLTVSTLDEMNPQEELTLINLFASQLTTALFKVEYDEERAQQIQALEAAAVAQQRLLETVRELSTPAIPIYDGILALPLVGNIDTGRAGQIMETVLTSIAREHASVVILDVTGVPVIDTGVANHLVQVTQAAQLLGARAMLVGIKPEVAQTLVQLGVDLSSIITRSNLQSGVAFALNQRGLQIIEIRS